jgi:hypothetical protein
MKLTSPQKTLLYSALVAVSVLSMTGCSKEKDRTNAKNPAAAANNASQVGNRVNSEGNELSKVMTVAQVRTLADGSTQVLFNENAQILHVSDPVAITTLRQCFENKKPVNVQYSPWEGVVKQVKVSPVTRSVQTIVSKERAFKVDLANMDVTVYDNPERLGVINTTSPGLVNVIPDMATAQQIFDYIAHQCCAAPGPYQIDLCIPFQYAYDGCYARAHKMCYVLNNTYHYDTHKIFSFANAGSDVLSVQAQKWGGCCVNWWYHVAPLVNIKTPAGVKAYVFDPAMFNQPVLLSVWLHAQENPVCAGTPHVSMINLQPTWSYSPADYSGYAFDPDPSYSDTDYTLVSYSSLTTCH